jgi:type II secretory pathway pseudopilin PulG
MSPRSDRVERGFTLIEVAVALLSLVLILVLSAQLLFATRRAALRQQLQVEARQVGRAAVDYVTYQLRGATDLAGESVPRNPLAILSWVWMGNLPGGATEFPQCGDPGNHDGGCTQRSYNNVTDAALADVGTDIITVSRTDANVRITPINWGGGAFQAANVYWRFDYGCPQTGASTWGTNDTGNYDLFKDYTGCCLPNGWSQPMVLIDGTGNTMFYQITDYKDTDNADTCTNIDGQCQVGDPHKDPDVPDGPCMFVVSNPGSSALNLPGGQRDLQRPVSMLAGVRFIALRVCRGWLEQKQGIFDPTADGAGGANACDSAGWNQPPWTPLLPNIEDLQIAYSFSSGNIFNNLAGNRMNTVNNVPMQGTTNALDATAVLGFRVSVTARSSAEVELEGKVPEVRPALEDRAAGTAQTRFYYYPVSAGAMIRNRTPQS